MEDCISTGTKAQIFFTLQDFRIGYGPIANIERSKDEAVRYMQNTL